MTKFLKRLAFILFVPVWVVGMPVSFILSPVAWLLTGIGLVTFIDWWAESFELALEWTMR